MFVCQCGHYETDHEKNSRRCSLDCYCEKYLEFVPRKVSDVDIGDYVITKGLDYGVVSRIRKKRLTVDKGIESFSAKDGEFDKLSISDFDKIDNYKFIAESYEIACYKSEELLNNHSNRMFLINNADFKNGFGNEFIMLLHPDSQKLHNNIRSEMVKCNCSKDFCNLVYQVTNEGYDMLKIYK